METSTRCRPFSGRTFLLIACLAGATSLIMTALVIRLAVNFSSDSKIFQVAVAACIFDLFALFSLCAIIPSAIRAHHKEAVRMTWIPGVVFGFIGSLLTLVAMAISSSPEAINGGTEAYDPRALPAAGLAITISSIIFQAALYVSLLPRRESRTTTHVEHGPFDSSPRFCKPAWLQPDSYIAPVAPSNSTNELSTSGWYASPRSTLHRSITRALHSIVPRIKRPWGASTKKDSLGGNTLTSASQEILRGRANSEAWHSSGPSESFVTPLTSPSLSKFDAHLVDRAAPTSHPKKYIQTDILLEGGHPAGSPPPSPNSESGSNFNWPQTVGSRSFSASTSRTLIHPLFRDETAGEMPPLLISPGTSILASPLAGQMLTPQQAQRLQASAAKNRRASFDSRLPPVHGEVGGMKTLKTFPSAPSLLCADSTPPLPISPYSKFSAPKLELPEADDLIPGHLRDRFGIT